ncbi:MAG: hypothetical protein ACR2N2_03855 [Acidimicrobiia bacterium]
MRRSTTALILIAIAVVAVALALRSGTDDASDDAQATTTSQSESTPTTGQTASSTTIASSTTTTSPPIPPGTQVCDLFNEVAISGAVLNPELVEASGLAASRTTPDVLWSHNDSRGGPILYAFGTDGADLGGHEIEGAFALDWEDMGAGPDSSGKGHYLYVGDLGDNFGIRDGLVSVWQVPDRDPAELGGVFTDPVPIVLEMPDGPYDAEALFIDPVEPALYIVTKSRSEAFVFKGPMTPSSEPHLMELVSTLFLGAEVSGADMSPDGAVLAFRGYDSVWMWSRTAGQTIAEALATEPCTAPSPEERQGEAIALTSDWGYYTVSEGSNPDIHRVSPERDS